LVRRCENGESAGNAGSYADSERALALPPGQQPCGPASFVRAATVLMIFSVHSWHLSNLPYSQQLVVSMLACGFGSRADVYGHDWRLTR
jgi:hypothetical protein